jgi:hypothetical protein
MRERSGSFVRRTLRFGSVLVPFGAVVSFGYRLIGVLTRSLTPDPVACRLVVGPGERGRWWAKERVVVGIWFQGCGARTAGGVTGPTGPVRVAAGQRSAGRKARRRRRYVEAANIDTGYLDLVPVCGAREFVTLPSALAKAANTREIMERERRDSNPRPPA